MNAVPSELARDALIEGFGYITRRLNEAIPKKMLFAEANPNASLKDARYRLRQALPGLRAMKPGMFPPDDRDIYPWTLGHINDLCNPQTYVCVVGDYVYESMDELILFLKGKNWTEDSCWKNCIVEPVRKYHVNLLSMLPELTMPYGAGEDGLRRDAKIYDLASSGWTNQNIAKEIERLAPEEKWEAIGETHIHTRLDKYTSYTGKPSLNRRSGRPRSR